MKRETESGRQRKPDQRVRVTKEMLRKAFLNLLAQKPVQNITVKELCEAAGINRGTFYLHYYDVYDLLEKLENEILEELRALLSETPVISASTAVSASDHFTAAIFAFFQKNIEMCGILLGENGDSKFVERIIKMAREKSVREYMEVFPHITSGQAEVFYAFVANGFLGLLRFGLQNPKGIAMDELLRGAELIIQGGVRYLEKPANGS